MLHRPEPAKERVILPTRPCRYSPLDRVDTPHSTVFTLLLVLWIQFHMWQITTPQYFPLSQAQGDLQQGFQPLKRLSLLLQTQCCVALSQP